MEFSYIPFEKTEAFSKNDTAYVTADPLLRSFYQYTVEWESFPSVIDAKKQSFSTRNILVECLLQQHEKYKFNQSSNRNIKLLLQKNTFTITTAHQPSLFTGPLYFIYKIVSTINLCRSLKERYSDYNFVPVFWSGAEDHDFEEINHAKIFRNTLIWENNEEGAVGSMSTKNILELLPTLKDILGDSINANFIYNLIHDVFTKHATYGHAALELVHRLFAEKGLVVIDPSDPTLKKLAIPLFSKEIIERASENLIQKTQQKLIDKGFKSQAFPRPINLFYLRKGERNRIDFKDGKYQVLKSNLKFTEEEILLELNDQPERFSPNVNLRPLYQELILPNLAYIGGGGELAYWLERKSQFEYFDIPYPMLIRRDSVLWIDKGNSKKMNQLNISLEKVWESEEILIQNLLKKITNEENNISNEFDELNTFYDNLAEKMEQVDPSLNAAIISEKNKSIKGLKNIESKIRKVEKRKNEVEINKIKAIKSNLFPNNSLQERKDNFIPLYLKHGEGFFDALYQHLNPIDKRVKVVREI